MKHTISAILGGSMLFFVVRWKVNDATTVGIGASILLLALSIAMAWCFVSLSAKEAVASEGNRPRSAAWFPMTIGLAVAVFFFDVLFLDATLVSHPYLGLPKDPARATSGIGYSNDPWAGFLIEAPGILATQRAFARGDFPLWNHDEACGSPFAANGELAVSSLIQAPLHLSSGLRAWDYYAVLRFVIAALSAGYLGSVVGLSRRGMLLTAVIFAFSGHLVTQANLVHGNSEIFSPLIVAHFLLASRRRTLWHFVVSALTIGVAANGGNPQPVVVACLCGGVTALFDAKRRGDPIGRTIRVMVMHGLAVATGLVAAAINLLPLVHLLGESVTRELLQADRRLSLGALRSFFCPDVVEVDAVRESPTTMVWYVGAASLALVLSGRRETSTADRRSRPFAVFAGLEFFVIATPIGARIFGDIIPVLSSVNWAKYTGCLSMTLAVLAGLSVDSWRAGVRRSLTARVLPVLALITIAATAFHSEGVTSRASWSVAIAALAVAVASNLDIKAVRRASSVVPLLVFVELLVWRPAYPQAPGDTLASPPPPMTLAAEDVDRRRTERGEAYRVIAAGDLAAPMTSSLLGWQDPRSVSPMPLRSYHRWFEPYCNPGEWPPYLLLGASRELLLSPCLDLCGVKWIAIKDHKILTGQLVRVIESYPWIVFGELHRSIDVSRSKISGLRSWRITDASFLLDRDADIRFGLDVRARSVEAAFEVQAEGSFEVTIGSRSTSLRLRPDSPRGTMRLEGDDVRDMLDISVAAEGPVRLVLNDWNVDRYLSKSQADFAVHSEMIHYPSNVMALENKTALPIARFANRARVVATDGDFDAIWEKLVATGEGWDWRNEVIIAANGRSTPTFSSTASSTMPPSVDGFGYSDDGMDIQVTSGGGHWLHVAVVNDGFWRATIGGRDVPVYRSNGPFMAVAIEQSGVCDIRLKYEPWPHVVGTRVSCFAVGLLLILGVIGWRRRNSTLDLSVEETHRQR